MALCGVEQRRLPPTRSTPATHRRAAHWERGWPRADVEAIAALYAADAVFYSAPFRDRQAPADYVAWAFGEQASAACRFGAPVVAGDRAAVDWWAVVTDPSGDDETLAGTSLLRFDSDGLVVEQRDAWASSVGRHELPDWAPAVSSDLSAGVRELRLVVTAPDSST